MKLLLLEKSNKGFVDIYNIVSEKARQGDDKAVKTFLVLQKELKRSVNAKKSINQEHQEDDDLII